MMRFTRRTRHVTVLVAGAAMLNACGGGGAAPLSEPNPPDAGTPTEGTPPAGTPPTTPPATPPAPGAALVATITTPERTFSPSAVTVAANGTVTWQATDDRHQIVFVGAAPTGGNPGELDEGTSASRTFSTPGTYEYECLRHRDKGMRGTIVVQSGSGGSPAPSPQPPSGSSATVTTPNATFSPANLTISAGGSVTWQFSEARHNVTFQGAAPTGGNIPDQEAGTSASRTFAAVGTYDYVCTRHSGMTGRVTVQ